MFWAARGYILRGSKAVDNCNLTIGSNECPQAGLETAIALSGTGASLYAA
jgi:hypothetical protein